MIDNDGWLDELLGSDNYKGGYLKIEREIIRAAVGELRLQIGAFLSHCESPIEALMGIALWRQMPSLAEGHIFAQYKALDGKYRVDFLLNPFWYQTPEEPLPQLLIAVECDGHEFHEKTKEQAAADKRRDRDLTRAGLRVMRFTGSEIYRDALKCAAEVDAVIDEEYNRWYAHLYAAEPGQGK